MDLVLVIVFLAVYPILASVSAAFLWADKERPGFDPSGGRKTIIFLALVLLPTIMLLLSMVCFTSEWKGAKGLGWFGVIHEEWAGATVLPIWLVGVVSVAVGIFRPQYMLRSKANFIMAATVAAVCGWYTFATVQLNLTGLGMPMALLFALAPGLPFMNYVLLLRMILRRGQLAGSINVFGVFWSSGITATLFAKYYAALAHYSSLPESPPSCFIVTAAARGHGRFVGSRPAARTGLLENPQLCRMRALERRLQTRHPAFHRALRAGYNVVGPLVASRIRSPWSADAVYVLLKPLELAAAIYCRMDRA